jgi:predicted ATPase
MPGDSCSQCWCPKRLGFFSVPFITQPLSPREIACHQDRKENVLWQMTSAALAGHGQAIMIAGDPGIGKTRTAREFADYAERQGAKVLWGRCYEDAGAPPYWPWVQIIRVALADSDGEALLRELGDALGEIAGLVPEIRPRLSALAASNRPNDPAEAGCSIMVTAAISRRRR